MSFHPRRISGHPVDVADDECACPFCGGPLDFSDLVGVRGALADDLGATLRAGAVVHVDLCGVPIPVVVIGPAAPADAEGTLSVVFLVCSDDCARAVRLASVVDSVLSGRHARTITATVVSGLRLTEPGREIDARFETAMAQLLPMLMEFSPRVARRLVSTSAIHGDRLAIVH